MKLVKIVSIFFICLIVLAFVLFAFRLLSVGVFWMVVILVAIVAYFIVPKLKKD